MLPSTKVVRAIKSVGEEIASITWPPSRQSEPPTVWVASGRRVSIDIPLSPFRSVVRLDTT